MSTRILVGDARHRLPDLPDQSVHCVITSPPYWGLRDYGDTPGLIGMERHWPHHLDALLDVFDGIHRVLRDDGTLWLNYGDAFAGGGGTSGPGEIQDTHRASNVNSPRPPLDYSLWKHKELMELPSRLVAGLKERGWLLRQRIVWAKSNPMPESVKDRPVCAAEYVFLLVKRGAYFYDHEATRVPAASGPADIKNMVEGKPRLGGKNLASQDPLLKASGATNLGQRRVGGAPLAAKQQRWDQMTKDEQTQAGANLRNVWPIATQSFSGLHFATFPSKLVEPCLVAGTSVHGVCSACGAQWRRLTRTTDRNPGNRTTNGPQSDARMEKVVDTVGWEPTCSCDTGRVPAVVLDPFGGAGTVALVAHRLGRDAILVEADPESVQIARDRLVDDSPLFANVEIQ